MRNGVCECVCTSSWGNGLENGVNFLISSLFHPLNYFIKDEREREREEVRETFSWFSSKTSSLTLLMREMCVPKGVVRERKKREREKDITKKICLVRDKSRRSWDRRGEDRGSCARPRSQCK